MLSLEHFDTARNDVYNLAYGQGSTLVDVAKVIQQRLEADTPIHIKETRTGEVVKYIADTSKARAKLQYDPKVPMAEGVRRSVEWYQEHLYT